MPRLKGEETMLGTSGAARHLGVGRSTLTYWRRKGEIRPTVVEDGPRGPRFRFSVEDLERFRARIDYEA